MKYLLVGLLALLAAVYVFSTRAHQAQQTPSDRHLQQFRELQQKLDEELPIVDSNAPKPTEASARARREVKDKRYNLALGPISDELLQASRVYDWPSGFSPIPVVQSTAIVIGSVTAAQAHISQDRSAVYSEITTKIDQILKNNAGIKPGIPIVSEREGGRVRFPSGSIFRYFVDGLGMPKVGSRYLLFLERLEDGDFRILTGYELRDGQVTPLDKSGSVKFEKYQHTDETAFLAEVRESILKQN